MLMFREEKSPEDEIKAWQFWHSRQHSVKQRILDAGKYTLQLVSTKPKPCTASLRRRSLLSAVGILIKSDRRLV